MNYLLKNNKFLLVNSILSGIILSNNNKTYCKNSITKKQITVIKEINYSKYTKLYKSINKLDNSLIMIKKINIDIIKPENIINEIKVLELIKKQGNHKNIIQYNDYYKDNNNYYLITEYINGNTLHDKLQYTKINDKTAIKIMYEISLAILFLHNNNIIHSDIKPENIMINDKLEIKLIDFGSAININNNNYNIDLSYTKIYASPEAILDHNISFKLDMWSLGCIFYILLSNRHPFDPFGKFTEEQILNNIINKNISFIYPEFNNISIEIKQIIIQLLEKDNTKRLNIYELVTLLESIID